MSQMHAPIFAMLAISSAERGGDATQALSRCGGRCFRSLLAPLPFGGELACFVSALNSFTQQSKSLGEVSGCGRKKCLLYVLRMSGELFGSRLGAARAGRAGCAGFWDQTQRS